jgi:hypothetical protein
MNSSASAVAVSVGAAPLAAFSRWLYIGVAGLMSIIVLAGFWPYYSGLFSGGEASHWVIHVHAGVFTGWMVLLAAQVILVLRRRVRSHQGLGRIGAYYGVAVLLLGLVVTFVATAENIKAGRISLNEGAGFLVLPLGDMLLFAAFFGFALLYRRKKELHKRLMVLATIALLFAPAARLGGDSGLIAILIVWLLPLGVVLLHDLAVRRRVERVYLIGTAVLLLAFARTGLMDNEGWQAVGRALLRPLL